MNAGGRIPRPIVIEAIEVYLYRAAVKEAVKTSFGSIPARPALVLRIRDQEGGEGWGEVWCNFPPYSAENKLRLFETVIGPAALRRPFANPADAWHDLSARTHRWAIQSGEFGPMAACLGGLDLALWDLAARRAGRPLRRLLREDAPDAVPVYASGLNPDTAFDTVARCRETGFTAFKVKVAFDLDGDLANIARIRRDMRAGERLMVDANQGWSMEAARVAVPRFAAHDLDWIEEPIAADRPHEDWAELSMIAGGPLAGGENVSGFAAFDRLIAGGAHAVVQPDMLKWGGVTGCSAVGRRAVEAGRRYCPHWLGGGIGLLAAAQVLAATGGEGLLEYDVMENPLRGPLGAQALPVEGGRVALNDAPGIGMVPDLAAIAGYLQTSAVVS